VLAIKRGNRTGLIWSLFITLVMGLVFLTIQLYDYQQLHFGAGDTIYGTTFFTLTGFHGAHVTGGALFLFIVLLRSLGGQFDARNHEAVEACSMYWHFVDVVWIALFVILYVIPS
jgi:cytochrome c oxidase subunit 3